MSIARKTLLSPIEPAKATDQIIRRISQAINSGQLKPGEQLPVESELAEQLNVAQMTLRQALSILRELGYIETVRGRNGGSFVSLNPIPLMIGNSNNRPTLSQVRDLLDFQLAIDTEASGLAAQRADSVELNKIKSHLDRCLSHHANSPEHWLTDNAFHTSIAEASGSKRIVKASCEIQYETIDWFVLISVPNEAVETPHHKQHTAIFEAIAAGEVETARKAAHDHVISLHEFISTAAAKFS